MRKILLLMTCLVLTLSACKQNKAAAVETAEPQLVGPTFSADSAWAYCAAQCDFGPRTMNSKAHDDCEAWIIDTFKRLGATVMTQKADLKGWDGKVLRSTNIIASINPEAKDRMIICAHWDCRPWADNDADSTNWKTPVMGANDGASGIGVMLELCRIINNDSTTLPLGIDFVCFDAEDYGAPDWADIENSEETWALGAQHFAREYANGKAVSAFGKDVNIIGGILLDMVGGQGAHFYLEALSMHYAPDLMRSVWAAANEAGFSSTFISQQGGGVTDDHKPLNEAGIPTIDIISYHPDCEQSSFGPTWHTIYDDMQHMDKGTLQAVGQTLIQYLYSR